MQVGADIAAQAYVDLMAEALQILSSATEYQLYLIGAASGKAEIGEYVRERFIGAEGQAVQVLLDIIHALLAETAGKPANERFTYAAAVCLCMDQRICYTDVSFDPLTVWQGGKMNLHSLVPIRTARQPVVLASLNRNHQETGICIAPKFPVSGASMPGDANGPSRRLSARNALYGINGKLENVIYYPISGDTPSVRHIFLPERLSQDAGKPIPEATRIIFSPLTDRTEEKLLKLENDLLLTIGGLPCSGIAVEEINDPKHIEERFRNAWLAASQRTPDIFFAPEMLATDKMVCIKNGGSTFLKPMLKEAALAGGTCAQNNGDADLLEKWAELSSCF